MPIAGGGTGTLIGIVTGYTTLAALRQRLGFADDDHLDDVMIEQAIEAASRMIDAYAMTRFYTTALDEVRYYTARSATALRLSDGLDDILSVSEIALDAALDLSYATVLAATGYVLAPHNAPMRGEPYTLVQVAAAGYYPFQTSVRSVRITGKFGYSATAPAQIEMACQILAAYLFKLKDSPLGIMGNTTIGQVIVEPKVAQMVLQTLQPIRNRRTRAIV